MADDKEQYNNGRSLTGGLSLIRSEASTFDRDEGIRRIGTFRLRGKTDDLPQYVPKKRLMDWQSNR
jgi:potassium channel subfamily K, other eukaryote